jgi:hypothetical protein
MSRQQNCELLLIFSSFFINITRKEHQTFITWILATATSDLAWPTSPWLFLMVARPHTHRRCPSKLESLYETVSPSRLRPRLRPRRSFMAVCPSEPAFSSEPASPSRSRAKSSAGSDLLPRARLGARYVGFWLGRQPRKATHNFSTTLLMWKERLLAGSNGFFWHTNIERTIFIRFFSKSSKTLK